jgi:signal peptidase II
MLWTAFWVFLLDQASKWLVVHWMDLRTVIEIDVLPPLFNLRMAWNRGVNFGLFAGFDMRWVLVAVAIGIAGLVVWWVAREGGSRRVHVSAGLLIGGALGNVVDRVLYGAVADFLNFPFFGEALGWALEGLYGLWAGLWGSRAVLSADRIVPQYSLNVADIAIFVGAVGLVLFAGRGKGQARRPKPAKMG